MVNQTTRRASDAGPSNKASIAPVIKRKRRASCLGEQERRERKRAIDREAQRSLREKTKTHIAELEKTIQILRDQDRNGATASLLGEIEQLRQENERLRDVIDSVKSVVGNEIVSRAVSSGSPASGSVLANVKPRSNGRNNQLEEPEQMDQGTFDPIPFSSNAVASHSGDLDGLQAMDSLVHDASLGINFNLDAVGESVVPSGSLSVPDSPNTTAFAPFMQEVFGPSWRCPSPFVLHIGNPTRPGTPSTSNALCPIWKKSNQLFGRVFSFRPGSATLNSEDLEAGLLFRGVKEGWSTFSEWMQSPALRILKEVDEFLFCHLGRLERLAATYKSFKLLKYYLNATKEELEKVPEWLRPRPSQARTKHPIALDFFAWPTLRERLVQNHTEIFQTEDMSRCYSQYLKFDWPFSFEDTFFFDETTQCYYPSPLFERYHRDLRFWGVTEKFYESFPEMMVDIEGDRARFQESEVH